MANHTISAEELDLLTFFETEPTRLDPEIPWPYNDFLYEVRRADVDVSFAVAPALRDVRMIVKCSGARLYELNAVGVKDVRYFKDERGECLEISLSVCDSLFLRLTPAFVIEQRISSDLTAGA